MVAMSWFMVGVVGFETLGGLNDRRGLEPVNKCSQSWNSSWLWIIAIRLGRGLERVTQYGSKEIKLYEYIKAIYNRNERVCVYEYWDETVKYKLVWSGRHTVSYLVD
jgi:hypothetical protein